MLTYSLNKQREGEWETVITDRIPFVCIVVMHMDAIKKL